jgi:hypothetical protein
VRRGPHATSDQVRRNGWCVRETLTAAQREPASETPAVAHGPARHLPGLLQPRSLLILLAVVIAAGTAIRLMGVRWGLPLSLNPDERVIVRGALDVARRHSFEPSVYFRPDHVEIQLSDLAYLGFAYLVRGVSPDQLYAADPSLLLAISRLITVGFGVGTMVLAYLIGARFNRAIGVITTALVAFFPPFVLNSSLATPDVPLTFAVMMVMLGCMRYLAAPKWRHLAFACLGVSIGFAIKYPAALGSVIIAITVVTSAAPQRDWRRIASHGAGAVGMVVGFLFLISPVLFTNASVVIENLTGEAGSTHPGADNLGYWGKLAFYAAQFSTAGGLTLVLFFGLGVFFCVRLKLRESVPLMLGAIIWVLLSVVPLHWARWGLPMYLTPLLIAPIGVYYGTKHLLAWRRDGWPQWVALALISLAGLNLVSGSIAVTADLLAPDTRAETAAAMSAKGISATNTDYEGYTTFLPGGTRCIFDHYFLVDGRLQIGAHYPARYVMVSSQSYDRYFAEARYADIQHFYRLLDEQYPLVATVQPDPEPTPTVFAGIATVRSIARILALAGGGVTGPTIKVYAIPTGGRLTSTSGREATTPMVRCSAEPKSPPVVSDSPFRAPLLPR